MQTPHPPPFPTPFCRTPVCSSATRNPRPGGWLAYNATTLAEQAPNAAAITALFISQKQFRCGALLHSGNR